MPCTVVLWIYISTISSKGLPIVHNTCKIKCSVSPFVAEIKASLCDAGVKIGAREMLWEWESYCNLHKHKTRLELKNGMPFTGYPISGTLTVSYIFFYITIIFESILRPSENEFIYKFYKYWHIFDIMQVDWILHLSASNFSFGFPTKSFPIKSNN